MKGAEAIDSQHVKGAETCKLLVHEASSLRLRLHYGGLKLQATSVCGLKLLVYEAFSLRLRLRYGGLKLQATSVCGLKLLVYEASSLRLRLRCAYGCATEALSYKLLVYAALSY